METIKISLDKPIYSYEVLDVASCSEHNGVTTIVFNNDIDNIIHVGDTIVFKRDVIKEFVGTSGVSTNVSWKEVKVLSILDKNTINVETPEKDILYNVTTR